MDDLRLSDILRRNSMTVTASAVAIGDGACAGPGEIALSGQGKQIVISRTGVRCARGGTGLEGVALDSALVSNGALIMDRLRDVFGDLGDASIETPDCSLAIRPDGTVLINGEVVGCDPKMPGRAAGFLMRMLGTSLQILSEQVSGLHESMLRSNPGNLS